MRRVLTIVLLSAVLTGCTDNSRFRHYQECLLTISEQEWVELGCDEEWDYIP